MGQSQTRPAMARNPPRKVLLPPAPSAHQTRVDKGRYADLYTRPARSRSRASIRRRMALEEQDQLGARWERHLRDIDWNARARQRSPSPRSDAKRRSNRGRNLSPSPNRKRFVEQDIASRNREHLGPGKSKRGSVLSSRTVPHRHDRDYHGRSPSPTDPRRHGRSLKVAVRERTEHHPLEGADREMPMRPRRRRDSGVQVRRDRNRHPSPSAPLRARSPQAQQARRPPEKVKDCMICVESRALRHFPTRPPTSKCEHDINVCSRCLRNWIKSQTESKVWDQIDCPECLTRLEYDDMRLFAPKKVFARYDTLTAKAALEAIPNFTYCPSARCKSGQIHTGPASAVPKFKCLGCKITFCLNHRRRWHKGETCAQFDYRTDASIRKAEEEASRKYVKETAKRCPGLKCGVRIEKNAGCDHMTCTKCRFEWCWICLAPYGPIRDQGNSQHKPTCIHYRAAAT